MCIYDRSVGYAERALMLELDEREFILNHQTERQRYDGREDEYDESAIFWANYGEV